MLFSIIVPLYNKEKYIKDTINSVLLQTYTDFEIIVINDSSTDNSLPIVQSINDKRLRIYTKTNGGVSEARNYGIKRAKGEYICFLDADDLWKPEYLKNLYEITKKHPFAGMICSAYSIFKDSNKCSLCQSDLLKYNINSEFELDFFKYSVLQKQSIALTSAVCIKREVLTKIEGPFSNGISIGEDIDVWVRVASISNVVYSNKPFMLYRWHAQNSLCVSGKSIKASYPYWNWYNVTSRSKYKNAFTTRMIYTLARKGFFNGEYSAAIHCLSKIKGISLSLSRLLLFIRILLKLCMYGEAKK